MRRRPHWPILIPVFAVVFAACAGGAATLDHSTITEVINRVSVIDPASRQSHPAKARDVFTAPNVLRTGADSRAELVADDQTVTRVGSNTIFSFAPASRTIELEKGSILFNSPSGKGGGSIRTPAASAAVLGTTLIVSATREGAMKVMLIEGKGRVSLPGGDSRTLHAGQLVIVLPGRRFSEVLDFRLREQATQARLLQNFKRPLPSQPKIVQAERLQQREIDQGRLVSRGERPSPPRDGHRPPPGTYPPPPQNDNPNAGGPPPPPPPPPPGMEATARQAQKDRLPPPPPPPPPRQRGSSPPPSQPRPTQTTPVPRRQTNPGSTA